MRIRWYLLFFIIPATEGLWKIQESRGHSVAEKTLKTLLESCYENDDLSNSIVILGDYDVPINELSIIRISSSFKAVESSKNHKLFNFKASKVVLMENESEELESDLKLFKTTKWWNHMASFFIIIENDEECKNFKDILTTTWKMNIINSILICSSGNTSALYTLNPFANYAPYPWKRIENRDNFNVFHQSFNPNVSCNHLNYDKTRNLHGYKIRASHSIYPCGNSGREDDYFNFMKNHIGLPFKYLHAIIKALNASCKLECKSNNNHETNRMLEDLKNNNLDLSLQKFALHEYPEKIILNSYIQGNILAIVQLNPEVPTLYKIIHMWSPPVLVGASIVLATFFTILAIIYHNFSSAILDLTRLLTYVSIKLDNRSHSFRIYFTTILIFMVISNGVFQGKIAAYLTKPERFPTVETIDELIQSGYKFYTYEGLDGNMTSQCPKCNITSVPIHACINFVRNATLNVCVIRDLPYYHLNWSEFEVEPIKNPFAIVYLKHLCRDDWPLYNRVNDMTSAIMESGLPNFWKSRITYLKSKKRQARDRESNSAHYRPVKLVKLDFAFKFLAAGLFLSLGCFFIEQLVADYRNP